MGDLVYFILHHIKGHIMSLSAILSNDRFDHLVMLWAFRNKGLEAQYAHCYWGFIASIIPNPCSGYN